MLSIEFQRKVYEEYALNDREVRHGNYVYSIAYNSCCAIHTWIIRRKRRETDWYWLQPLDISI